jgi:hypothetical protein
MKIPVIKKLLEQDLELLRRVEEQIAEGETPEIAVEGDDEGEQLTHVYGAIWIKEQVAAGMEEREALRAFSQKVRNSIS